MIASIPHDAIWVNLTTTCWSLLHWFVLLGPWGLASRVYACAGLSSTWQFGPEVPLSRYLYVRQCQKCQKPSKHPFVTFGTPSVRVFAEITRLSQFHTTLLDRSSSLPSCKLGITTWSIIY